MAVGFMGQIVTLLRGKRATLIFMDARSQPGLSEGSCLRHLGSENEAILLSDYRNTSKFLHHILYSLQWAMPSLCGFFFVGGGVGCQSV